MSARLGLRTKVIALVSGIVVSMGAWTALSSTLEAQGWIPGDAATIPIENETLQQDMVLSGANATLPVIDVRAYESATFGAQEALQSVGKVFQHAVNLDFSGGNSQQSTKREMVRSVGGAKFVAIR